MNSAPCEVKLTNTKLANLPQPYKPKRPPNHRIFKGLKKVKRGCK